MAAIAGSDSHARTRGARGLLARCALPLVALLLAPGAAAAGSWSLRDFRDWIAEHRPADPPALAGRLPAWPEPPGHCAGIGDYVVAVGRQFRRLCGPQIAAQAAALGGCASELAASESWDPFGLLLGARRCQEAGTAALEVWGKLAQCTLTSYLLAAEMTEQQRRDWQVFIGGLTDLDSLLRVGELFEAGKLGDLGKAKVPRSLDEALKLAELGQEVRADLAERAETAAGIPEAPGGVWAAIETLHPLRGAPLARLRDEGVALLEACRPAAAKQARTRAELAHFARVQGARAAYVLAEHQLYCVAEANRFAALSDREQQERVHLADPDRVGYAGHPSLFGQMGSRLRFARVDHELALTEFASFLADPALGEERIAAGETRRTRFAAEVRELIEQTGICKAGCGARESGCRLPLETLARALRAQAENPCAAALGLEAELEALADRAEAVQTASNNYAGLFDRHRPRIETLLERCEVNRAMAEAVALQRAIQDYERAGLRVEACWAEPMSALEQAVAGRRAELEARVAAAERELAVARRAAAGCRWQEAEAAVAAAYDGAAATGCAPTLPGVAELYAEIDALAQELTARAAQDGQMRRQDGQRTAEIEALAALDLERARSDHPERCAAVERLRAAAAQLAGLDGGGLCPGTGTDPTAAGSRLLEAAAAAEARHRAAVESLLAQGDRAEAACDPPAMLAAAGELEALPPVCGVDRGALAAGLRQRQQRLVAARQSARDRLGEERRRLERALAGGAAGEAATVLAAVQGFAPEGVPRDCYGDLLDALLATPARPDLTQAACDLKWPGTQLVVDPARGTARCVCPAGAAWSKVESACLDLASGAVTGPAEVEDCRRKPGTLPDPRTGRCRCPVGDWDDLRGVCVDVASVEREKAIENRQKDATCEKLLADLRIFGSTPDALHQQMAAKSEQEARNRGCDPARIAAAVAAGAPPAGGAGAGSGGSVTGGAAAAPAQATCRIHQLSAAGEVTLVYEQHAQGNHHNVYVFAVDDEDEADVRGHWEGQAGFRLVGRFGSFARGVEAAERICSGKARV